MVRRRVEKPARNGGKFAFLTLSDPTGEVELMVMPELLADMREQLEPGKSVVILTEVRRRDPNWDTGMYESRYRKWKGLYRANTAPDYAYY